MLSNTSFLLKIGPGDMKYWRLWHFSLSSNKLMAMLNNSLYIKVRITKICKTCWWIRIFSECLLSTFTNHSLESLASVFMDLCLFLHLRGMFYLISRKVRKNWNFIYFLQIITYLGKRNTYRRHISISYFIEKLFRLTEVYCHLLLPKNYLIIGYFNI